MILAFALAAAVLFGCGAYLLLKRDLLRVVAGIMLISQSAMVTIIGSSLSRGRAAIGVQPGDVVSDPLPQALALTALVIGLATVALLLALVHRVVVGLPHRRASTSSPRARRSTRPALEAAAAGRPGGSVVISHDGAAACPGSTGVVLVALDGRRRDVGWLAVAVLAATLALLAVLTAQVLRDGSQEVVTGGWPAGVGIVLHADVLGVAFALLSVARAAGGDHPRGAGRSPGHGRSPGSCSCSPAG